MFIFSIILCYNHVIIVWTYYIYLYQCWSSRIHIIMGKAVAVLNSSEGVTGTIYFAQEGDGKFWVSVLWLVKESIKYCGVFSCLIMFSFRSHYCDRKYLRPQAWAPWIPCSCPWWHHKWLHVNWYNFNFVMLYSWNDLLLWKWRFFSVEV